MAKRRFDFSGVSESGIHIAPGKYVVIIDAIVEDKEGKEYPYDEWKLKIAGGSYKNQVLFMKMSQSPKALFKLRDALLACGLKVPTAAVDIDTAKLVGRRLGVTVVDNEYNGNITSVVSKTFILTEAEKTSGLLNTVATPPSKAPTGKPVMESALDFEEIPETNTEDDDEDLPF